MLHITITKDGKIDLDEDTPGLICIVRSDVGTYCLSYLDRCTREDALRLLWSLDTVRDNVLRDHPDIAVLYSMKNLLLQSTTITDLSKIKEAAADDDI